MNESTDPRPADGRPPAVGDLVVDTGRRGILARVMACDRGRYALRPARGGLEWDAGPDRVRPATASDVLADRMRAQGLLRPQDAR
ncbi:MULTISPECIES: hypothetical protein [unclassified Streptomyces]|uniref:hypothetical protein n=1 Tax=unclassified Streptomyces TaxID=2593676 RepID=UPI002E341D59|nr:hypothetical protein [Streptomyces sp. NBC_01477]